MPPRLPELLPSAAALLLLMALAAGCFVDGRCERDDDCAASQLCHVGACVARECASDEDCAAGQTCQGALCLTAGAAGAAFSLQDRNPLSPTYGELVGPERYAGKVLLIYLADAG